MKKLTTPLLLAALLLAAAGFPAIANDKLIGTWKAVATEVGGTIVISKNHEVTLAPKGFAPLKGVWSVDDKNLLRMAVPNKGEALSAYYLKGDKLTLQHADGRREVFMQNAFVKKAPAASTASRPPLQRNLTIK